MGTGGGRAARLAPAGGRGGGAARPASPGPRASRCGAKDAGPGQRRGLRGMAAGLPSPGDAHESCAGVYLRGRSDYRLRPLAPLGSTLPGTRSAARLHLDEDDHAVYLGHQVQFTKRAAVVAGQNAAPPAAEVVFGHRLAPPAEPLPSLTHSGEIGGRTRGYGTRHGSVDRGKVAVERQAKAAKSSCWKTRIGRNERRGTGGKPQ